MFLITYYEKGFRDSSSDIWEMHFNYLITTRHNMNNNKKNFNPPPPQFAILKHASGWA